MAKKKTEPDSSKLSEVSEKQVNETPKLNETSEEQSKDSPKIITWKDFLVTYIVFFLVFGAVGYMRGRAVKYSPERMNVDSVSYLRMAKKHEGKKTIAYQCEEEKFLAWDIDNNKIQLIKANYKEAEGYEYSPAIFKNEILVTAFLSGGGGAISIFTAKEVFSFAGSGSGNQLFDRQYIKLIAVAVIASIIGYQVGYDIAINQENCSDSRYYDYLQQESVWSGDKGYEHGFWLWQKDKIDAKSRSIFPECRATDTQVKFNQEENLKKSKVEYLNFTEGEKSYKGSDLSSTDFDALEKFENVLDDFSKNCGG